MLEAALIRMFLGAQKIGRGINFGLFENSFSGSQIGEIHFRKFNRQAAA